MRPFRQPSLADIYVKELKTKLDETLVPLFTPDTVVDIGTIGRFEGGRFNPRDTLPSNLTDILKTKSSSAAEWSFSSSGSLSIDPQANVKSPLGQDLLAAKLSLSKKKSVVASFTGMTETRVAAQDKLDMALWKLYKEGELDPEDVVVWYRRAASSGTVIVVRQRNVEINVTADPTPLTGGITLQGLAAGVQFTGGTQADFQMSGPNLVAFIKVKGLTKSDPNQVAEIRGFIGQGGPDLADLEGVPVPDITTADILEGADFSDDDLSSDNGEHPSQG